MSIAARRMPSCASHYELMDDGRFFGTIKGLKGLWADGDTLEQCRANLMNTLEDWLFISLKEGLPIPKISIV
jgi:predicted RNase H-like HicB family nuclease